MSKDSSGIAQSKKDDISVSSGDPESTNIYDNGVGGWFGLYTLAETYIKEGITAEMIWGSQYDAMMKWMTQNGIDVKSNPTTDLAIGTTIKNTNGQKRAGAQPKDRLSNVYDLLGLRQEYTQEANSGSLRVCRSNVSYSNHSPSYRGHNHPGNAYRDNGTRLSLYINP